MSWKRWRVGLVVAVVSGIADALIVMLVDPNIAWRPLVAATIVMAAKAFNLFLKQHPVEAVVSGDTEVLTKAVVEAGKTNAEGNLPALAFAVVGLFVLAACAPLQPGADSLVVRVEQAETGMTGTLDLVVKTDDVDRAFWQAKAPGFHAFAEFLRAPVGEGTNALPRGLAMVRSLDVVKRDYQAGRASSNAVVAALATSQGLVSEAVKQLGSVTNLVGMVKAGN